MKRWDPTGTYRILAGMLLVICLVMVGLLTLLALVYYHR